MMPDTTRTVSVRNQETGALLMDFAPERSYALGWILETCAGASARWQTSRANRQLR